MNILKKIIMTAVSCLYVLMSASTGFALTPKEVVELKKAGVSDRIIELMIKQNEVKKDSDRMGTREEKDADGNTVIIYSTGKSKADEEEAKNLERAWEMLRNIQIRINKKK